MQIVSLPLDAFCMYWQHNSPMCYIASYIHCFLCFKKRVGLISIKIDELLEKTGHTVNCFALTSVPTRALSTWLALNKQFLVNLR